MTLKLQSTDNQLNQAIQAITADDSVSLAEFRSIRDKSDAVVNQLKDSSPALASGLTEFQSTADVLTDKLQKLAIAIRKNKLDQKSFDDTKAAIEHQLAYIVLSYASSVERYTVQEKPKL